MPRNNDIEITEPMYCTKKFLRAGSLNFKNQLNAIKVTIIDAPTVPQLRHLLPAFMLNSWTESPKFDGFTDEEIQKCFKELFAGEILPTGMETIGITWCVEGLDLVDVTHLIRHRMFSFSAQCSDRDLRDLDVMVKPSIANSEFMQRYTDIVYAQHQLYMDMMDSGDICTFDARTVLPISKSHFYNVRCCIKDLIAFVNQRADEQIQTQVDNIVALKLWLEVLKLYPFLKTAFNPRQQSAYYIKQCKAGKTTIFPPNANNDVFLWPSNQFFHGKHRDEFIGGHVYLNIRDELLAQIDAI
jgi:thymidylate synthase (FAD)